MKTMPKLFLSCIFCLALSLLSGCGSSNVPPHSPAEQTTNAVDVFIEQLRQTRQFETSDQQITVLVKEVDEQRRLIEPKITLERETMTIEAQAAQISIDIDADMLTITLVDARVASEGGTFVVPERAVSIPLSEIID